MKLVLAVGHDEESASILDLVGRLKFRDAAYHLTHVVERFHSPVPTGNHLSNDLIIRYQQLQDKEARERLSWAEARMKEHGISSVVSSLGQGFVADQILAYSEKINAGLICIGSRDEAPINKVLIGSVGRKLITKADQSLLVARGSFKELGPIDAVFATDHSDYAQQCLDVFLKIAPQGIRKLTILTVYPKAIISSLQAMMPNFNGPLDQWIVERLEGENKKTIEKLAKLGYQMQSRVMHGEVDDCIDQTMENTQSQLLILGAQGHGFVERLTLGSVSFQQAAAGKHSVLVLRKNV